MMKTTRGALALLFVGAVAMGCGDGGTKTGASAEPAKSGAAATTAAAKGSAAAATTGAPATGGAAATAPAAGGGDLVKHMPKDCDEARVYVNLGKLLVGDAGTAIDSLMAQGMAKSKDGKKGEEVVKVLKDGGIEPMKSIKEIAVCGNKDKKKTVIAIAGDMSKADKPADVLAKAIETGSGKAPKKEEAGDVTYLIEDGGTSVIAVVGKTKLVAGDDKAAVEAAVKGGGGEAAFGDASSHVVWAKTEGAEAVNVSVKETGDNFDLKVDAKMGADKAKKAKEEGEKALGQIDEMAKQMPFAAPLVPAAKSAKMEVAGDNLVVTTSFSKAMLGDFLKKLSEMKPEDLMKGMRF